VSPIPIFSTLFQRLSRLFPAFSRAGEAFLTGPDTTTPRRWTLNETTEKEWRRWRTAFLTNPRPWALPTPELASRVLDWAWLWQDKPVLTALEPLLEEKSMHDTAWRALQGRLRKPPAWLLVSGPEALQWQSRLQPVLNQLPEPLTLFVQPHPLAMPAPAMPGWDHTTAAVICRGLECSSPVRDLDYLLEALQDG